MCELLKLGFTYMTSIHYYTSKYVKQNPYNMINEGERKQQGEEHIQKDSTAHGKNLRVHQQINSVCMSIYTYSGKLFRHKNEILPYAATWKSLGRSMLSEINQSEKDKYV